MKNQRDLAAGWLNLCPTQLTRVTAFDAIALAKQVRADVLAAVSLS